jgi:predicted ATP-grasp superfamily ATP-dependent carboligase
VRQVCQAAGDEPLAFLARQAAAHDLVWVLAPETGGMLSSLRAAVSDRQWLGCSSEAIAIAGSKRATATRLRAAGIAATEPAEPGRRARQVDGPWVVKPDDGCGATGARRHGSFGQACRDHASRALLGASSVIEPWVEGEPLSLSLLCGPQDAQVLALNRQHIAVDEAGWLRFDGVSIGPLPNGDRGRLLTALGWRVWEALPGLAGFVGIDVIWHPVRGPVVIEVNPRVTCAYAGLSTLLQFNVAGEVLARHQRGHGSAPAARLPRAT